MNDYQYREIQRGEHTLGFFAIHPVVPEPQALTEARVELRGCLDRATQLGVDQLVATRQRNGNVEGRKDKLRRDYMMMLKRVAAKPLEHLVPADVFAIPHKRDSARTVAEAALRIAEALEPHPVLLANAGLKPDLLKNMRHQAHELALVERRTGSARNRLSTATADLAAELKRAAEIVITIEGLMMAHCGSDKQQMKYWNRWRRVPKRKGRPPKRKGRDDD